ncbi:hypothetical protein ACFQ51_18355 [Streptomyces kaempferi]
MPTTRHAALLALFLAGFWSAEVGAASSADLDLTAGAVHTKGSTRTLARTCPLDEWGVYVLGLRATHLGRRGAAPYRLVASATSAPNVVQSSVGSGFGDIARRSGLSTRARKVEPRDITRYVARKILNETGQLSEVARHLGLSSLDVAAAWPICSGTQAVMPHDRSQEASPAQAGDEAAAYVMAEVPDDTFGAATDPLPPKSPEAPPLTTDERFEYLLNNPDLYAAARSLPGPSRVGRPAQHPPVVYLIFLCAISLFGSARATACHLQRPLWWDLVRMSVRTHMGDAVADALCRSARPEASGTTTSTRN